MDTQKTSKLVMDKGYIPKRRFSVFACVQLIL